MAKMQNLKLNVEKENLKYVVAVDDSSCALHAFRWTDFIAKPQDKVAIIHSFETEFQLKIIQDRYPKYPKENNKRYSLEILNNKQYNARQRIKHYVNKGKTQSADMLVTGLHGKTYENMEKKDKKATFGSTSDLSLRSTRCTSFFVHRDIPIPDDRAQLKICVGIDGSQNSRHAFETAVKLLTANNTLYVVHIKTDHNNDGLPQQYRSQNVVKDYTKYAEEAQKALGFKVDIQIKLIQGTVKISDTLNGFAKDNGCHILCIGADGMTAYCNHQPILGSVSDECVKNSKCNVIITQVNEFNSTPRGSVV